MQVHQIRGVVANTYVIELPGELLVVDVAVGATEQVLGAIESQLGLQIGDITWVIATHDDPDHSGGITVLAGEVNATLATPIALAQDPVSAFWGNVVRSSTTAQETFRPRNWHMYANPQRQHRVRNRLPARPLQFPGRKPREERQLEDGNVLPGGWRVIATPGHSQDSICLYHEDTGGLITGDTLLGSKTRGAVPPSIFEHPGHLSHSVARLWELAPRKIYPGHGSIIDLQDSASG